MVFVPTACDICKKHDGKIRPLDKLRQGESAPMFHPFCRCSTSPKMSRVALDEILGVVNNSSGAIHGALNNKNDPHGKRREDHAKRYYQTLQVGQLQNPENPNSDSE